MPKKIFLNILSIIPYRFSCRKNLQESQNPQITTWWQHKKFTSETNNLKHRYRKLPTSKILGSTFITFNTVNSTKDLVVKIKNEKVPQNCNMVSFDVKSLFTSVPLEYTIDIIIKPIFEDHEITTIFTKSEMKKLLTLCTKSLHFSFNSQISIHIDGVVMPLGPVIANIFMAELETTSVPKLEDHVQKWRRFVDDTFAYVKAGSVVYVLYVFS